MFQCCCFFGTHIEKMAHCAAFRLSDLAPCGCRPKGGSDLCSNHQSFYDKDIWMERFVIQSEMENRKYLLQGINYPEVAFNRHIQNVIEFSLTSGRIILTKEDVEDLPCMKYDLFTVMVKTGKVNPNWSPRLYTASLHRAMKLFHPSFQGIPVDVIEPRIVPFLTSPFLKNRITILVKCIFLFNRILEEEPENRRADLVRRFIQDILDHPVMQDDLMLGSDYILNLQNKNQEAWKRTIEDSGLLPILKQKQTALKAQKRARMMEHKGGIMEKVFHPDKVERWLEEGGEELVDMMFG